VSHISSFGIHCFSTYAQKASAPKTMVLIFWKHYVAYYKTIFVGSRDSSRYIRAPNSCRAHAQVETPLILEQAFFYQARRTCQRHRKMGMWKNTSLQGMRGYS
jgi:hypothetical protein